MISKNAGISVDGMDISEEAWRKSGAWFEPTIQVSELPGQAQTIALAPASVDKESRRSELMKRLDGLAAALTEGRISEVTYNKLRDEIDAEIREDQ